MRSPKPSKATEVPQAEREAVDFAGLLAMSLHILTDRLRARLSEQGFDDIRRPYGFIFRAVAQQGASINELASLLEVSKQAASKIVDEMASAGYVTRDEHHLDRRSKIVRLTERGRRAMQTALQVNRELESALKMRVGEANVESMRLALTTFASETDPELFRQRRARPFW